ncbi:Histidine kinase [Gammaproteobacteria bacterium]
MDPKKEAFLAGLRETFKVEASEHLEAITAGFVSIERANETEQAPIVERMFREAHSLKGAARSVNLPGVEALCTELENIFAAMKRRELTLSATLLDAIHPAVDVITALCANPGVSSAPASTEKETLTLAALRRVVRGEPDKLNEQPVVVQSPLLSSQSSAQFNPLPLEPSKNESSSQRKEVVKNSIEKNQSSPPENETPKVTASQETVRIATRKLQAILLEAEELVGAKLAASAQADGLYRLGVDLGHWNRRRIQQIGRMRRTMRQHQDPIVVMNELIDSEILQTKALEQALLTLARSAQQEARSLGLIVENLLEDTKKALLLPCSTLLGAMPRPVRDLAREQNKEVDLVIRGEDIEVDRRVLDELKDPLIHLLRNSIDHGIEKPDSRQAKGKPNRATITIAVAPLPGNRVEILVSDDGAGIDVERVRQSAVRIGLLTAVEVTRLTDVEVIELIFHSGLSTSPLITDLSGRGLGMAIVREKVEQLGGMIKVTSILGIGTTFRLLLPLTRATFRGVFVTVAEQHFAIPTANVARVTRIKPNEVKTIENRQTIAVGGRAVSLARLRDSLGLSGIDGRSQTGVWPVVVMRVANREVAFLVDEVLGEQEVMVKNLGPQLPRVRHIAGASLSASGTIIPVLNVPDLLESAGAVPIPVGDLEKVATERRRLLIAEDSITARTLVKSILEGAGYQVVATVDGLDALTRLKTDPFDLVVSDVDMPRMNGFELTSRIRADQNLRDLPVVLVTALGSQKDREYGVEVGANAYLVKSDFDQSNLLAIIQRLL